MGLDKPSARIWVSSLTSGSAKQACCPNVWLKAWHGGARQTFGPSLGLKFDMRERKTSVLPQCKVEGLAWWGWQTFGPNFGFSSLTCGSAKQAFCPNVRLQAWHGGARQNLWPESGFQV